MDAGAYSVMVGAAESYFGAYALALGFGPAVAGLMVTVPVLVGAIIQLITPWAVKRVGSHRTWVSGNAIAQAACLALLPLAALFGTVPAMFVAFGAASLYWGAGLCGGPAWNTWIEELVPMRVRTRYFAWRQRVSQACVFTAFIACGLALQMGKLGSVELGVFAGVFLISAASRFVSGCFLGSQSEPSLGKYHEERIKFSDLFGSQGKSGGQLVVYLLAMQVAVQISGPYFTPFLLQQEKVSYLTYMVLIAMGFVGKVVSLQFWGRVGQRIGAVRLLWFGGFAVIPLASLWCLSDLAAGTQLVIPLPGSVEPLTIAGPVIMIGSIQILSGFLWAAYELAMALLLLQGIPRRQRTSMLTWYNLGNSAAMVAGGLVGTILLRTVGEAHSTYLMIFAISSVARLCMLPLLMRVRPNA